MQLSIINTAVGQLAHTCVGQDRLADRPDRAVADHHEAKPGSQRRIKFQGANKGMRQTDLILDRLHPPPGSDKPVLGSTERTPVDRQPSLVTPVKARGIDAVVDLHDAHAGYVHLVDQEQTEHRRIQPHPVTRQCVQRDEFDIVAQQSLPLD